jgi:hypothetical protein
MTSGLGDKPPETASSPRGFGFTATPLGDAGENVNSVGGMGGGGFQTQSIVSDACQVVSGLLHPESIGTSENPYDPDALDAEQAMWKVDDFITDMKDMRAAGKSGFFFAVDDETIKRWQDVAYHLSWHYYNLEGK